MPKNFLNTKLNHYFCCPLQRGARVVEGARLESGYTVTRIEGSNPFLSAKRKASQISDLWGFFDFGVNAFS